MDVGFNCTGSLLCTASADGCVGIFSTLNWSLVVMLRGHKGEVVKAAFTMPGHEIVTCGSDRSVRLWDPYTDP